jgi:glutamine cyclotransferase
MKGCIINTARIVYIFFACMALFGCTGDKPSPKSDDVSAITPAIIDSIAHDTAAFTQGLLFHNGQLYESTGLRAKSSVRCLSAADGSLVRHAPVEAHLFGEGLALKNGFLVQLTWKAQQAIVCRASDFSRVRMFTYEGEGWGLTADDRHFIMSNGSDTLYFRDNDFRIVRAMAVTHNGRTLSKLNELEYAKGRIYANVWHSNFVFEIHPQTGRVQRIIDCSRLVELAGALDDAHVLNGIAYNPAQDVFYLTGKKWAKIFIVKIGG